MHSCGRGEAGAFSREGKLIRFVGVCWIEKTGGLFATETGVRRNSSSLWLRAPGSEGWGHDASPAACKPQIAERGWRPVISDRSLCTCPL